MVDHSQGHAAYPPGALQVSEMNLNPGGSQCGFEMAGSCAIIQPMIFAHDHSTSPNQPKGIKAVLEECDLWIPRLRLECKKPKCEVGATLCCAQQLLGQQPDFQEQKSLVQEVIEAARHLCIFLPKFHCEFNFIEFFWGAVKKYATLVSIGFKRLESDHSMREME